MKKDKMVSIELSKLTELQDGLSKSRFMYELFMAHTKGIEQENEDLRIRLGSFIFAYQGKMEPLVVTGSIVEDRATIIRETMENPGDFV